MTIADLKQQVEALPWYHTMELADGVWTRGENDTAEQLNRIGLPQDLTGLTVLDLAASNGFYSFEAERRGASRVLAVDQWAHPTHSLKQFLLAREALGSQVEYKQADINDVTPDDIGTFDLVFFMGLLYHLENPMLGLRHARALTAKLLIVESEILHTLNPEVPIMRFWPGDSLAGDASNFWSPNPECLLKMPIECGFTRTELISTTPEREAPLLFHKLPPFQQGRGVVHAFV
jgi:tRNA (mo5U34)-methyltransferase